jgi:hypothetical protein
MDQTRYIFCNCLNLLVSLSCSWSSTQFLTNVPSWTWQDCKRKVAHLLELTETPQGGGQSHTLLFELQLWSRSASFLVVYEVAVTVFCLSTSCVGTWRQGKFCVVDLGVGLPQFAVLAKSRTYLNLRRLHTWRSIP